MFVMALALAMQQQSSPLPAIALELAKNLPVRAIVLPPADSGQRQSIARLTGATIRGDSLVVRSGGFFATVSSYQTLGDSGKATVLFHLPDFGGRPFSGAWSMTLRRIDGRWMVIRTVVGAVS